MLKKDVKQMGYAEGARARSPASEGKSALGTFGQLDWRAKLRMLKAIAGHRTTPEQKAAMEYVRDMLEPGKLGGEDRTFNYADVDAVVSALIRDTSGLSAEVQKMLRSEGKNFQANLVQKALCGRRGPLANAARKRVYRDAPTQIGGQLRGGLQEGGIDTATGKTSDDVTRALTFGELRRFEAAVAILQQMQEALAEEMGVDVDFPGGLSQRAISHQLEGKLGAPPGAVFTPRPQD